LRTGGKKRKGDFRRITSLGAKGEFSREQGEKKGRGIRSSLFWRKKEERGVGHQIRATEQRTYSVFVQRKEMGGEWNSRWELWRRRPAPAPEESSVSWCGDIRMCPDRGKRGGEDRTRPEHRLEPNHGDIGDVLKSDASREIRGREDRQVTSFAAHGGDALLTKTTGEEGRGDWPSE